MKENFNGKIFYYMLKNNIDKIWPSFVQLTQGQLKLSYHLSTEPLNQLKAWATFLLCYRLPDIWYPDIWYPTEYQTFNSRHLIETEQNKHELRLSCTNSHIGNLLSKTLKKKAKIVERNMIIRKDHSITICD